MSGRGIVQEKVYQFIQEYIASEGQAPTLHEIAQALGIKSSAAVLFHVRSLEKKGLIKRTSEDRGITLVGQFNFSNIPVLGIANASTPLDQAEESRLGYLQIDTLILKNNGNLFAVKINGDSMDQQLVKGCSASLRHGNYAIVDRAQEYRSGDVVVAIINGGATIKVYQETKDGIVLSPNSSNPKHHPIYIRDREQLRINGKVVMALERPLVH